MKNELKMPFCFHFALSVLFRPKTSAFIVGNSCQWRGKETMWLEMAAPLLLCRAPNMSSSTLLENGGGAQEQKQ